MRDESKRYPEGLLLPALSACGARPTLITLCGLRQAQPGFRFVHLGPTKQCLGCDLLRFCQGRLQEGRIYVVVALRQKVFPCAVHEGGVRAVEVEEATVQAVVPVRLAIEGAVILFNQQECDMQSCPSSRECHPVGLFNGDRCQVLSLLARVDCPKGRELRTALLKRTP